MIQCALNAPLPPFWTYYTPKDEGSTPFYTNYVSSESSWTHPSDPTFKQLASVLQGYGNLLEEGALRGDANGVEATDALRKSLKVLYTNILQQAE